MSEEDDPFGPWVPTFKVWNLKRKGTASPPKDAVYVGRPSKWGNPFPLNAEADRETVLAQYEDWLLRQPVLLAAVRSELRGKHLSCWCAPKLCHADVLLRIANTDLQESIYEHVQSTEGSRQGFHGRTPRKRSGTPE